MDLCMLDNQPFPLICEYYDFLYRILFKLYLPTQLTGYSQNRVTR
jgi:hypothetical protein